MIALLTGKIAHKSPEFIIMDVNGVGYRIQIPFSTYYDLPEEGKDISLNIYTHVKEDAINLYGFRSLAEKNCFQLLISVSGIGPKLGKDILSNIRGRPRTGHNPGRPGTALRHSRHRQENRRTTGAGTQK